jgi:hypothetical protein
LNAVYQMVLDLILEVGDYLAGEVDQTVVDHPVAEGYQEGEVHYLRMLGEVHQQLPPELVPTLLMHPYTLYS